MMLETGRHEQHDRSTPESANSSEVRLGPSPETLMTPGMIPAAATATTTGTAVRALLHRRDHEGAEFERLAVL